MHPDGILFCGGGTGGHVLPGLSVAAALRARGRTGLRWIGDPQRIEAKLVPNAGITLLPYGLSRPRPTSPRWIIAALGQAWACFRELSHRPPRVVVALGGYAALLPGLLAPLTRRPLIVLEQNARPGRTNRLLARFADAVVTQFPEAAAELPVGRVRLLGNPVRVIRPAARGHEPRLRLLVVGGSLAAKSLNDLVLGAAARLATRADLHLVHIAGEDDRERVAAAYASAGFGGPGAATCEVFGFVADMPALYDRIDLALSRAGATTVAELCAGGIGALYVPLPWAAEDHQTANARAVERIGGARVLPQATTRGDDLASAVEGLLADRGAVAAMGAHARALARPHAAAHVADLVDRVDRRRLPRDRAASRARFQRARAGNPGVTP